MNLTTKPEVINRQTTTFVYVEKHGPFAETAPQAFNELAPLVAKNINHDQITEMLGLSISDKTKKGNEALIYQAGVSLKSEPEKSLNGLSLKKITSGKYAKFLLTGSYAQIGPEFEKIFSILQENKINIRPEFCIEKYLNTPDEVPEEKLLTEILIPIE